MPRFKILLPEKIIIVEADTEENAVKKASTQIKINPDDLIAWEMNSMNGNARS